MVAPGVVVEIVTVGEIAYVELAAENTGAAAAERPIVYAAERVPLVLKPVSDALAFNVAVVGTVMAVE